MSVQCMAWVLENSKSRLAARLVLLSLANHADQHGMNAWPSLPTIAREAHVSVRQAQRALVELARIGEVVVYLGGGPGRVNAYRVLMDGDKLSPPPVTNPTIDGDKSGSAIRKNRPEPSKTLPPPTPPKGGRDPNLRVNAQCKGKFRERYRKANVSEVCTRHPESGVNERGTCWACYAESYGYKVTAV